MEFDIEKIKAYYEELVIKKDEAVTLALANKDIEVAKALEEKRLEIEAEVIAKITAEAEAPFKHDIELYEKFIKPEPVVEPATEEPVADASDVVIVEGE